MRASSAGTAFRDRRFVDGFGAITHRGLGLLSESRRLRRSRAYSRDCWRAGALDSAKHRLLQMADVLGYFPIGIPNSKLTTYRPRQMLLNAAAVSGSAQIAH
jgi:hypothetical protein